MHLRSRLLKLPYVLEYSQAALEATNLLPGNAQDIYVVNTTQQQIQVYQALLSINNSGSGEDSLGLEMRLLSGDASLLSAINQALDLTLGLSLELARTINADELILPDELDSALDLIGPEDSSAGGYRNALRNSLNERYNRYLLQQNLNTVQNWGEGAFSKFLTDSDLLKNKVILVEFPDGTRVNVDVTKIAEVLGSFEKLGSFIEAKIALDLEINLRSIASDEQMSFPQSAGQFSNFNADLTRALEELALRFGRADELRP